MLTTYKSEQYFFGMLHEAGLDRGKVTPAQTWEVFKKFCEIPVRCLREKVLVECGNFYPGENLFHITFVREFTLQRKEEVFEQLHCDFFCDPNANLPNEQVYLWSTDFPDLSSYFAAVEKSASFQKAMQEQPENWRAEVSQFIQ